MTDFNEVFITVKRHCKKQSTQIGHFRSIAQEARVTVNELPIHLDELQKHGLIKYSMNQYIYMTSLGQKLDKFIK